LPILAHKIALDPNQDQEVYFRCACGTARFAYNWALAEWQRQYKAGEKPTALRIKLLWNKIRHAQFPWSLEVTKCAGAQAIRNLGTSYSNFFQKKSRYPKFKKRGVRDRFSLWNDQFSVEGRKVRIPKLGWVRMREALRFAGKILSAVVSCTAGRWFISISVETQSSLRPGENQAGSVGVDLGIKSLAVLSTGEVVEGPKAGRKLAKKLTRLARSLSRKVRGSANWKKAKVKLSRLYARIANLRKDTIHKLTTRLAQTFRVVGIEDLNVAGMVRNHCLARSISDQAFAEVRRQLEYKCEMTGTKLVIHDRWLPSSKTCSDCGFVVNKLPLSVRTWSCPSCGVIHDRDVNAAVNLKPTTVGLTGSDACGEVGSGRVVDDAVKPALLKQELRHVLSST